MNETNYQDHYFLFKVNGEYYPYSLPVVPVNKQVLQDVITHMQASAFPQVPAEAISIEVYMPFVSADGAATYLIQYVKNNEVVKQWTELQVEGGLSTIDKVAEVVGFLLNEHDLEDGEIVVLGWYILRD